MKIKLSRKQWEDMGKKAAWLDEDKVDNAEEVNATPFFHCTIDMSSSNNPKGFGFALKELCAKYNVKFDIVPKTIDI